jgi:hypothetical protein
MSGIQLPAQFVALSFREQSIETRNYDKNIMTSVSLQITQSYAYIQSVTQRCGQILDTSPTHQKKKVHMNMSPETICDLQLKEYCMDTSSSSALMCGQGLSVIIW